MSKVRILLVGNPNSGKSHLFNRLTLYNEDVGNWPGVTNDIQFADVVGAAKGASVIDVPGIYSIDTEADLKAAGVTDQSVASDFILNHKSKYDLIFNIIDIDYLERSLHLTLELLDNKLPVVIVLNKMDRIKGNINTSALEEGLGVKVILANTIQKRGIDGILEFIDAADTEQHVYKLKNDTSNTPLDTREIVSAVFADSPNKRNYKDEFIDRILMHKIWGLVIFLLVMMSGFVLVAEVGLRTQEFVTDYLEMWLDLGLVHVSQHYLNILLYSFGSSVIIIIGLIPLILFLYLFLSILEDTGYIPRIMILADSFMRKFSLNGKAFIPIILGFGCNVPAIMATRIIKDKASRLKVALIIPFLSCSARLTIFSIFTLIFFEKSHGLIIFSLYVLGIIVAIITLLLLNLLGFKGSNTILYELPGYQIPAFKALLKKAYMKVRGFIFDAAGIIIIFATIITAFNGVLLHSKNFGVVQDIGYTVNKVLQPLGSSEQNWQLPYVLLSGIVAKEAMIASISAFYKEKNLIPGKEENTNYFENYFKDWKGVYCILVFILLCFPCVSVFSVLYKEFSIKVALASVVWSLLVGYCVSLLLFQTMSIVFM